MGWPLSSFRPHIVTQHLQKILRTSQNTLKLRNVERECYCVRIFLTSDCIVGILSYKVLTFHAHVAAWFLNASSLITAVSLSDSPSAMYSGYI
jgi:hypothetical protein